MDELKKTFVEWCSTFPMKKTCEYFKWKSDPDIWLKKEVEDRLRYTEMKYSLELWNEKQQRMIRDSLVLKP